MKKYKSQYYKEPIEVENIDGEILVSIITDSGKKVIYSWYDIIEKTSYSPYIKNSILASFIKEIPKNMLILGFGAGSYAKYFKDHLGDKISITGIEIDKAMIEIAKNEFNLNNINYFNLNVLDSLEILNKKKNNKFDTIFIDVYNSNGKIPNYFSDINFLEKIKNVLFNNGILIINYADYSGDNIGFYEEIHKNLLKLLGNNYCHILNGKDDYGNISGIYNLDKKYNSEEINLAYLEKVQNCKINYDSNLIKNTILSK